MNDLLNGLQCLLHAYCELAIASKSTILMLAFVNENTT